MDLIRQWSSGASITISSQNQLRGCYAAMIFGNARSRYKARGLEIVSIFHGEKELKILFLSQRFIYPMDTGGKIRTGNILEKLKENHDITLVSNVDIVKDKRNLDKVENICKTFHMVEWNEKNKRNIFFYIKILIKSLLRYPISIRNDYSKKIENKVNDLIRHKKYDVLICDFLQSSINIMNIRGIKKILFQHNVESIIVKRHFENSKSYFGKIFWWIQWKKMERYERKACTNFDGIIVVSDIDKCILNEKFDAKNVFSVPTGVDTEYFYRSKQAVEENSLIFTGSMDWLPNEDAILFFTHHILSQIKAQIPQIKLTVVGRNPSRHLCRELRKYAEINVVGWVSDVRPFIRGHALYVVPLRIGGGTRIKIYEAMAMGKAIVSTRIGTEGLPVVHGEHVLLADDAEDFARAVVRLLTNPEERQRLETAASDFVRRHCSWEKAALSFADACERIVNV